MYLKLPKKRESFLIRCSFEVTDDFSHLKRIMYKELAVPCIRDSLEENFPGCMVSSRCFFP